MDRGRMRSRALIALAILAGAGCLLLFASSGLRWRFTVLALVASGRIQDLSLAEALPMIRPRGGFDLEPLVTSRNPYLIIQNPYTSSADSAAGAAMFHQRCDLCHGALAQQAVTHLDEPQFRHGAADWSLFRNITHGIPGTEMRPQTLSSPEVWRLITYIRWRTRAANQGNHALSSPVLDRLRGVGAERLLQAERTSEDWLMFSGSYRGWRYSPLRQITPATVGQLRAQWILPIPSGSETKVESTPLVVDGVLYVTGYNSVMAVDARTGTVLWSYRRTMPNDLRACCGQVNRGAAALGTKVYVATLDAHLLALDAKTGEVKWDVTLAPYAKGYSATGAPLAIGDRVLVGISGGEYGAPGFLDAYDAESGRQIWRFKTVPEAGERGNETWGGDSWKSGGAPTWMTGAYDPELKLVYWGVGNPSPDYYGAKRPGDNLYSNCVLALDVATGALRWYFQFTPHGEHDWDSAQIPMLVDGNWGGSPRHLLLWANRNGFYYVLDRVTGEFLLARPFVRQTWAQSIDSSGRPVLAPGTTPTSQGTLVYPGAGGGTNWWPPSYNPLTGHVYVPVMEQGGVYYPDSTRHRVGELFLGGEAQPLPGGAQWTAIMAINAMTGDTIWSHRFSSEHGLRTINGILSTAGGVVLGSDGSFLLAVDAKTGRELWRFNTGSPVLAAPISYQLDGTQFVAVVAGGSLLVFSPR